MSFKRISIMIDAASGKQIDENGKIIKSDAEFMRLMYGETCILCATFYDLNYVNDILSLNIHELPNDAKFCCMGDEDFDETNSLMFLSEQTDDNNNAVDLEGDWIGDATADRSAGQVSFRVNTSTERFIEVLTTSNYSTSKVYFAIEMVPAGETASSAMASFKFKAVNRVTSSSGIPTTDDPTYLTATQIAALMASGVTVQFSPDGESDWNDTQRSTDYYMHFSFNDGEDYGDAVAIPTGTQGEAGDSAYDTWIATGNTGTEEEFLESLKGNDGTDGTGFTYQGEYADDITYAVDDAVTYSGSLYVSLTDSNTENDPETDTTNWLMIVAKGDTGDTGATGADGENGATGATGATGTISSNTGVIIGDGTDQDYDIEISNGDTNPPILRWNSTDDQWEYSNDGETFNAMGTGSGGTDWSMIWPANAFPQDIDITTWSNITAYPEPDYDSYNYPVWNVDYSAAEGLGLFQVELPSGLSNLIINITAQPDDSSATGDNMEWLADICIYRDGSAEGTITTITLGNTAFNTTGSTTGTYTLALSALTDGTLTAQAGDRLAIAIYPNTSSTTSPKQADWQVSQIKFEVS